MVPHKLRAEAVSYLAITKFDKYQHYKNRRPPWVKLYTKMLDINHPMNKLPVPTRYLFDRMLLLAANYDNAIPNDYELIARLLCMEPQECREGIDQLLQGRWISQRKTTRRASKAASNGDSDSFAPEAEAEKEKTRPSEGVRPPEDTTAQIHILGGMSTLGDERYFEVAKLLPLLRDRDEKTADVIASYAGQLPAAIVANITERVQADQSKGAGWVVAALKSELEQRRSA